MNRGDMVCWKLHYSTLGINSEIGIILNYIPFEERGGDAFPHWHVLFPGKGVLHCRESDLEVLG